MMDNINILFWVIVVNVCVLGLAYIALYRLNKAVDEVDR
jgi:hypothetical protein